MNRWDNDAIEYTDADRIKAALIGRSITSTLSEGSDYQRVLTFVLDDGTLLKAHATDGGCACSNGCFSVEPGNVPKGIITNVVVKEYAADWDDKITGEVELGKNTSESGVIRIFVYADLGEQLLVESKGGDNGYYGWGFWLSVEKVEATS